MSAESEKQRVVNQLSDLVRQLVDAEEGMSRAALADAADTHKSLVYRAMPAPGKTPSVGLTVATNLLYAMGHRLVIAIEPIPEGEF